VYNVKAGSSSGISIYNARGQKVSSLKLDNLQEGLNQVSWDAGDLPSGLYFYKTGAGAKSGKILKIR
jgi:flagellar hook assembly protein FlgD